MAVKLRVIQTGKKKNKKKTVFVSIQKLAVYCCWHVINVPGVFLAVVPVKNILNSWYGNMLS